MPEEEDQMIIFSGLQIDVLITADKPIEQGGLDHLILGATFAMPGPQQFYESPAGTVDGEEMSQLLPTCAASEWNQSKISGWYSTAVLGKSKIVYRGTERIYWRPPAEDEDALPRSLAWKSDQVESRKRDRAYKQQADMIKAADCDEETLQIVVADMKHEYPSEKQFCYQAIRMACSRHEGENELGTGAILRGCKITTENPLPARLASFAHRKGEPTWCGKFPCKEIDLTRVQVQKTRLAMRFEEIATPAQKRQKQSEEVAAQRRAEGAAEATPGTAGGNPWGKVGHWLCPCRLRSHWLCLAAPPLSVPP